MSAKPSKRPLAGRGPHRFSLTLRSKLCELERLCCKLQEIGARLGISPRCLFEVNLILDELFTNIISYGFVDAGEEHAVRIAFTVAGDRLVVVVRDDGIPFNPIARRSPELPCAIEDCQIGGLGIHLIKNLVDEVSYRRSDGTNILTFKKRLEFDRPQ